ncbi:hypothetical protein [Sphingomonas oligoaromativorans]|uniref:hypothetical protein n=1 Tax=Sphingomonas oligoaromativorans TaxID=575322 RepID=UPI00141E77AC|nr:hypothetical protein [Sphingomonas oligoaromativorans]NIJ32548.1 FkbH-like protein [Sphingomonas oligoaromativorans]
MASAAIEQYSPAERLRHARNAIGRKLAALVVDWPKYAASFANDPGRFVELETHAYVDYIAGYLATGDENYRHLYIGEKAKQLHDPTVDAQEHKRRVAHLLSGERRAFRAALDGDSAAQGRIDGLFDVIEHMLTASASAEVRVLFVGDCLYLDVISFLTAPALADGVRLRPTFVTSHDALEVRTALGRLADESFDIVCYSPLNYALPSDYGVLQRTPGLLHLPTRFDHADAAVEQALKTFDALADLFDCPVLVHQPVPLIRHQESVKERVRGRLLLPMLKRVTRRFNTALRQRVAERMARGQVFHLLDEQAIVGEQGLWAAGRYLYRSDLQHPAMFGALLAPYYRDVLTVAGRLLGRKLVACDPGDTLLDHPDRQATLLRLKQRGIILAAKVEDGSPWPAVEGGLASEDFASHQPDVERIAGHLNLKLKSFVILDSREGGEQFPMALALDPADPRSWRLLDLWADLLPARPGADRTDFYRQRDERQRFITAETEMDAAQRDRLYAQLRLRLTIREARPEDAERAASLVNRTNQFNMAGSRITRRWIGERIGHEDIRVLIGEAADRFGPMGTIGVLVIERTEGGLDIPVFVLSCRAFGFGMERALLEEVRRLAGPEQALTGAFRPTEHNQPCHPVYSKAGFVEIEGGWRLESAAAKAIEVAPWLTIDRRVRPFEA